MVVNYLVPINDLIFKHLTVTICAWNVPLNSIIFATLKKKHYTIHNLSVCHYLWFVIVPTARRVLRACGAYTPRSYHTRHRARHWGNSWHVSHPNPLLKYPINLAGVPNYYFVSNKFKWLLLVYCWHVFWSSSSAQTLQQWTDAAN